MDSKMSFSIWRRPGGKAGSALDARGSAFDARGSAFDAREAREVAGGVAVLAPHPIQVIDVYIQAAVRREERETDGGRQREPAQRSTPLGTPTCMRPVTFSSTQERL